MPKENRENIVFKYEDMMSSWLVFAKIRFRSHLVIGLLNPIQEILDKRFLENLAIIEIRFSIRGLNFYFEKSSCNIISITSYLVID